MKKKTVGDQSAGYGSLLDDNSKKQLNPFDEDI
jgi:hypothetical protein